MYITRPVARFSEGGGGGGGGGGGDKYVSYCKRTINMIFFKYDATLIYTQIP